MNRIILIVVALLCTGCPRGPFVGPAADCRDLAREHHQVLAYKFNERSPYNQWRIVDGDCFIFDHSDATWISEYTAYSEIMDKLTGVKL